MMKYVAFFVVALCALSSLAPAGAAQIRLNEVLADPASDWDGDGEVNSKGDEWVEIANTGSSSFDLSVLRITDESAGLEFRFALSGTLLPGEVRVIFGSEVTAWQSANGVGAFGLSLNNGGDTVYLYDVSGASPSVVDSQAYASAETADDRAIGRVPVGSGPWFVFDALNPYSGSNLVATGCMPSPGAVIECSVPVPVETSSWGAVKSKHDKESL
jgi:hypothetical protein